MVKKMWNAIGERNKRDMEANLLIHHRRERKKELRWFGGHELSATERVMNKVSLFIVGRNRY